MGAYLVLIVIVAMGVALGWRMTPAPDEDTRPEGLPRLLQLGVALTGLLALGLLLVPWFMAVPDMECTAEAERASRCVVGVREQALFGAAAFTCAVGAALAYVLRKGVFDLPAPPKPRYDDDDDDAPAPERSDEPAEESARSKDDAAAADEAEAKDDEAESEADEAKKTDEDKATEDEDSESEDEDEDEDEDKDEDGDGESKDKDDAAGAPAGHRKLEGPVFQAFVDDHTVELEEAIKTAVERLRGDGKRVAVVFSRGASKEANLALNTLAEAFDAYRYILDGTAAATEGLPSGETPDPHEADDIAGSSARHAAELALDLAGTLIETVMLLDTRVAFPQYVLGRLTELQSVCIAHAHDDVSAACQVVLPGTNPGEREGELVDRDGAVNNRRSRVWLVERMVEVLRAAKGERGDEDEGDSKDKGEDKSEDKAAGGSLFGPPKLGGSLFAAPKIPAPSAPKADADQPKADADQPKADADKPKADADKPKADDDKPKADADQPKTDDDKPKADADKPKTDDDKPKADADQPKADDDKPKTDDDKPKADADQPKTDADKPKADADQSKTDDDKPKADADQPKADDDKPKADADQPKADDDKPKADDDKPKADADKPKADADQPKADADQPKADDDKS